MPDVPKVPAAKLQDTMRATLKASAAVREGIATHAEKHAHVKRERHAQLEADRKLRQE